ncbi:MAG: AbrB/MazE/SpoVT family DNA-binding domain-containing protein [Thaumarchaeota archaeon]|nr:AbrB/MazE/SpoVT family DNA-binding domain-containing protein [Nitrososphaerota archaeon]
MEGIDITKISSRGQVVIPLDMRKDLKKGDKLIIMKNNNQIILKKASDFSKNIEEDLEYARRTEEALKRYDKGNFISMSGDEFLKELEKW